MKEAKEIADAIVQSVEDFGFFDTTRVYVTYAIMGLGVLLVLFGHILLGISVALNGCLLLTSMVLFNHIYNLSRTATLMLNAIKQNDIEALREKLKNCGQL